MKKPPEKSRGKKARPEKATLSPMEHLAQWARSGIGLIFAGSLMIFSKCANDDSAKLIAFELPPAEKEANNKINGQLVAQGFKMGPTGDALSEWALGRLKNERVVGLECPGKRKKMVLGTNSSGDFTISEEEESPQVVPFQESFALKVWEFRKCVKEKFGIEPKYNTGCRSNAMEEALCSIMKKNGSSVPCVPPGPTYDTHCRAVDIGSRDAEGRLPYLDAEGKVKFANGTETDQLKMDIEKGVVGLHDLVMECGAEVGLVGGFCGVSRDAFHYYEGDPQGCKRGDTKWTTNRDLQRAGSGSAERMMSEVLDKFGKIGVKAGEIYNNWKQRAKDWWNK